ncbi:MAG: hypothetical protein AAGA62_03865, partial [Bacteroidota bacterium]
LATALPQRALAAARLPLVLLELHVALPLVPVAALIAAVLLYVLLPQLVARLLRPAAGLAP